MPLTCCWSIELIDKSENYDAEYIFVAVDKYSQEFNFYGSLVFVIWEGEMQAILIAIAAKW